MAGVEEIVVFNVVPVPLRDEIEGGILAAIGIVQQPFCHMRCPFKCLTTCNSYCLTLFIARQFNYSDTRFTSEQLQHIVQALLPLPRLPTTGPKELSQTEMEVSPRTVPIYRGHFYWLYSNLNLPLLRVLSKFSRYHPPVHRHAQSYNLSTPLTYRSCLDYLTCLFLIKWHFLLQASSIACWLFRISSTRQVRYLWLLLSMCVHLWVNFCLCVSQGHCVQLAPAAPYPLSRQNIAAMFHHIFSRFPLDISVAVL